MKQHITPNQAKEITEEQFYKLFENQHWECIRRKDWADYHHKKITIGKMIEILRQYDLDINDNNLIQGEWSIYLNKLDSDERLFRNKELCNALWSAVKSVIESK